MAVNFPNILPSLENWRHTANTQTFVSALNGAEQTSSLPGSKWSASLMFSNLSKADGRALSAFVMALRGKAGKAFLTPYEARTALGIPTGTPIVSGADQLGGSLITSGWTASQTIFRAGDYFEVNSELKMITADVISNGAGMATLPFAPDLHRSPANGVAITVTNPTCTMRLANDSQASWQLSQDRHYSLTLEFIEALDA